MDGFEDELGISQNMAKTPMIITLARIIMRALLDSEKEREKISWVKKWGWKIKEELGHKK